MWGPFFHDTKEAANEEFNNLLHFVHGGNFTAKVIFKKYFSTTLYIVVRI